MSRIFTFSRGLAAIALTVSVVAANGLTSTPPAQAQGNACVAVCKSSHNQCRIATKGNASCDAQLQSCLQACIRK
jgi:hypothetical protein